MTQFRPHLMTLSEVTGTFRVLVRNRGCDASSQEDRLWHRIPSGYKEPHHGISAVNGLKENKTEL